MYDLTSHLTSQSVLNHSGITLSVSSPQIFVEGLKCPKNHEKIEGVSACNTRRDLCVQCPDLVEKDKVDCPFGIVIKTTDKDHCDINM